MELRELQFFVVSVDAGSLSQAAQILYTTQPHVSKAGADTWIPASRTKQKRCGTYQRGRKSIRSGKKNVEFHGRNPENSDGDAGEYDPYRIYAKQSSE